MFTQEYLHFLNKLCVLMPPLIAGMASKRVPARSVSDLHLKITPKIVIE